VRHPAPDLWARAQHRTQRDRHPRIDRLPVHLQDESLRARFSDRTRLLTRPGPP
jgi:hypothetical protein